MSNPLLQRPSYPGKEPVQLTKPQAVGDARKAEREILDALGPLNQFQREAVVSRISAKVRQDRQGGAA
ncbi:MAG: hypothetical protein AAFX78_03365 [Cyanobacteria bacterium J06638_20]